MIMDKLAEFCDATSVADTAGTALVGNVMDLEESRDIGNSGPVYCVISCATSIITGGAAGTIQFQLASDAQAAIAVDGTATEHFITQQYVTDGDDANDLDAGAKIAVFQLPMEALNPYERYLGILAIIATTTVTAGAIDAFLTLNVAAWRAMPDAVN